IAVFSDCFFFFQAEDGIRDSSVTGVQTCALPISHPEIRRCAEPGGDRGGVFRGVRPGDGTSTGNAVPGAILRDAALRTAPQDERSEERRVGKECRSRWSPYH